MITTVGQLAVNAALPPEMRDWTRVLDGPGVQALFQRIAEHKPDKYREIAKKLSDIGRDAAYTTGGFSFGLSHLSSVDEAKQFRQKMNTYIDQVMDTPGLPDDEKQRRILDFATKESANLEKVIMDKSWAEKNPLALQIKSKARGNPTNLRSLRGADVLYVDNRDRTIPVPITRSYSEGLSPAEYWAGTYGARKGVFDTKRATADAGFFSKQLNQAAHRLVVTAEDNDEEDPDDEFIGLPVDLDDNDSVGGLLAHGVGGYPRNTLITPKILQDLRGKGVKRILARSPIAGRGPRAGGVFARDVGHREFGRLPNRGDMVGLTASQALSEKLTQGQLSSKHSGGVAGAGQAVSGFKFINCLDIHTPVRMADGSVRALRDLRIGDRVLGADTTGNTMPVQVTAVYDHGMQECVRTDFRLGSSDTLLSLISTGDHKVLMQKRRGPGWLPAAIEPVKRCDTYSRRAQLARKMCTGTTHEPRALLLGMLLGDGCCTRSVTAPELACCDPSMIADIRPYLASLQLKPVDSGAGTTYRLTRTSKQLQSSHASGGRWEVHPIKQWLQEIGLWGKYSYEKFIPACVDTWDDESVLALIAGLIATDGCIYRLPNTDHWAYHLMMTARPIIYKVRELLYTRFGIYVSEPQILLPEKRDKAKRVAYRLDITAVDAVYKLSTLLVIPGVKNELRKIAQTIPTSKFNRSCLLAPRCHQTAIGPCHVMDIMVDSPDHLFVLANGLIVSNSLVQVPKTFRGGATHAQLDGRISAVIPAPQGGHYVEVAGQRHYVGPEFKVTVKPGQDIEAGDVLSEGTPNPLEIAQHKHIGEGRRYFINAFRQAYKNSGMSGHRRNIELLSRGIIDHVQMTDELDSYNPDDIVPYSEIVRNWNPRQDSQRAPLSQSVGKYLEKPTLHHSIGTKIRPSMIPEFEEFGVKELTVHDQPPPFKPTMVRAMGAMNHDPDFMTRFLGSNLQKSMLDAVHHGGKSDLLGTSFVPSLVEGRSFGRPELATRPKLF